MGKIRNEGGRIMKVVYGHTDSIYCTVESIEQAQEVCSSINAGVQKLFPNVFNLKEHPVQLEFEKYFKSLGVGSTKNRNAGLVSWKNGNHLDEDEFVMTGFTAKRISENKLSKEVQITVLKMWVDNYSKEEIDSYLNCINTKLLKGEEEMSMLIKRSRYREERFSIKCNNCNRKNSLNALMNNPCCNKMGIVTLEGKRPMIGAGIEGILFHNYSNNIPITDSYFFLKVKNIKAYYMHPINQYHVHPSYVSVTKIEDLDKYISNIDWKYYAEAIMKKAEPIYSAMGWDIKDAIRDNRQKVLEDWF